MCLLPCLDVDNDARLARVVADDGKVLIDAALLGLGAGLRFWWAVLRG